VGVNEVVVGALSLEGPNSGEKWFSALLKEGTSAKNIREGLALGHGRIEGEGRKAIADFQHKMAWLLDIV